MALVCFCFFFMFFIFVFFFVSVCLGILSFRFGGFGKIYLYRNKGPYFVYISGYGKVNFIFSLFNIKIICLLFKIATIFIIFYRKGTLYIRNFSR